MGVDGMTSLVLHILVAVVVLQGVRVQDPPRPVLVQDAADDGTERALESDSAA